MGIPPQSGQAYPMASTNAANGLIFSVETPLARQSSIYSLTLDEFQNTLREPGKSFSSMNMDELLKNIWTVEENQAMAAAMGALDYSDINLARQLSLQKQGSLTLPRTLSRKTVDEVWKSIQQEGSDGIATCGPEGAQQREMTFGEMTLEDFLVKAGVVREEGVPAGQQLGTLGGRVGPFYDVTMGGGERLGTVGGVGIGNGGRAGRGVAPLAITSANGLVGPAAVDAMQLQVMNNTASTMQQPSWLNSQYANAMVQQQQQQQLLQQQAVADAAAVYANSAKGVGNGGMVGTTLGAGLGGLTSPIGGGYGASHNNGNLGMGLGGGTGLASLGFGTGSPCSPVSDGTGGSHGQLPLSPVANYGMNRHWQGRKRSADGPVEKVIERRQRRMIKNRESAARSRARKQAYTVELEAEVTQLKEENRRLRKKQEEEAQKRKKQILATMPPLAQQVGAKGRALRRTCTGPW